MKATSRILALLLAAITLTACASQQVNDAPSNDSMMAVLGNGSYHVVVGGNGGIMNGQIGKNPQDEANPSTDSDTDKSDQADTCPPHSFSDWFVLQNPTCSLEGIRQRSCTVCGEKENESIPTTQHKGGTASCNAQAICTDCGYPYGATIAHTWEAADCIFPKHCTVCNASEGNALGHKGGTATCTEYAVCTVCYTEYGQLKEHDYENATCTSPKTCADCGHTYGSALGHTYAEGECITCGQKEPSNATVKDFYMTYPISTIKGAGKITSVSYRVSGSTIYVTVNGEKTSSAGTLTFGCIVYAYGVTNPLYSSDHTTNTLNVGSFSYTFAIENVITSKYTTYYVYIGAPNSW